MKAIKKRLTYANVMSSLAVFLVLGGGAAVAANQLGKNSVGAKQLKRNAVTAAKLKKNAVRTAKIKNGAVTAAKLKNGAVTGAKVAAGAIDGSKINAGATPFGRIVHQAQGNSTVTVPGTGEVVIYPLGNASYVQEADRTDFYMGAVDITFEPSCVPARGVQAAVLTEPGGLTEPERNMVSFGRYYDEGSPGAASRRANIGPYTGGVRFRPGQPTPREITLALRVECKEGKGEATVTGAAVDVIGIK